MVRVQLQDLLFKAFHGIHEEEKILGNDYSVDAAVDFHERDEVIQHINETIDYAIIYGIIKKRMSIPTPLLETLVMLMGNDIHQQFPDLARGDQRSDPDDEHEFRGLHRHRLFLSALHDPAALFDPGEDGPVAARGGGGSGVPALEGLPQDHRAAGHAGHHRGLDAGLHPRGGRIRHPRAVGRARQPDDRAHPLQ